jgi:hypothetical protein
MSPRLVPLLVGVAGFVVTLVLCAQYEGLDPTSVEPPPVAAQPALRLIPAQPEPASVEPTAMRAEGSGPAVAPEDSASPPADEREASQRRQDDVRGARTR